MASRSLALALLFFAACSRSFSPPRDRLPKAQCAFTSDCDTLLVCADGQCRAECRADRDCPRGELCRPSAQADLKVCLPPDAPALCLFASDCPATELCGGDHHCHLQCASDADCAGGHCEQPGGRCEAPSLVKTVAGCVTCGARCVDLTSDPAHCGACDSACPAGGSCVQGACTFGVCADSGPCNDACSGATPLQLTSSQNSFGFNPAGYTPSVHSCDSHPDGYFRFHLAQRSYVVSEITMGPGGTVTPGVGLLDDCSDAAPTACGTSCNGNTGSLVAKVLPAGDHLLVADSAGPDSPQFTVSVFPLPTDLPVDPLTSVASFVVTAQASNLGGSAVCGGGTIAHAWYAPNPCFQLGSSNLTVSTCGSDPGVMAGFVDGNTGLVSVCSTAPDPACDGGLLLTRYNQPQPEAIFIFATLPAGADGGFIRLSGTFQ